MNVRDLLCGMEDRAMDSQFLKDIRAIYDAKDYGDTEPDCKEGYRQGFSCGKTKDAPT